MQSICVCCGSSPGRDGAYRAAARELGEALAARSITLVYGGGNVGLMGEVADAALRAAGRVIGIIPDSMNDSAGHRGLTELHVVDTMHERKAQMYDAADAFAILPGGIGTLDELAEILTWSALALHHKPVGLINVHGYFDPLLAFLDHAVEEQFFKEEHRSLLITSESPTDLLDKLSTLQAAPAES